MLNRFNLGNNKITASMDNAPMHYPLLHYPLLINEIVYIKNDDNGEEKRFRKTFTLLETITSIVNEIGYSQLMSEFNEESIKDLEDEFYDILSTDDLSKKIEEEINKRKKICKICKKNNACTQHFNKPKNICIECFNKIREN